MTPPLRRLTFSLLCAALLSAPAAFAADKAGATAPAGKSSPQVAHRVVFQVNEDDQKKWHAMFGNIRNIQNELGKQNVRIAVVAIGPGLGLVTVDSLESNEVEDAIAAGVEFIACGNSMRAQHVDRSDLIKGVTVTPAGYVELMRRQQQGWSYLRP